MLDKSSPLWKYLSPGQKGLIEESFFLLEDIKEHPDERLADYSYIVFPIAKAYEGFLKQLFLEKHFINENQYRSTHFRIGKTLSPNLQFHLGNRSVYLQIRKEGDEEIANKMWEMWRKGRNVVFHYFPHNLNAVSLQEAESLVYDFIKVMGEALYAFKAI